MWNATTSTADAALSTAFIQGIGAGTLDPVVYGGFNVNDAYYCFNGATDYLGAANRATDTGLKAYLNAKYQSYQQYNEAFPKLWHVRDGSGIVPFPACILYSLYESLIAESAPPIYTLIVMIPCEYLWAWLASQLPAPSSSNLYAAWINENNDPTGAYKMGHYLDTYMASNPGVVGQEEAISIYAGAMTFELQNFVDTTTTEDPMGEVAAMSNEELHQEWENTKPVAAATPPGGEQSLDDDYRRNQAATAELHRRGFIEETRSWTASIVLAGMR